MASPIIGMIKPVTRAWTRLPRYRPMMKATARPMTLYFERKSVNSFHRPFGGGGAGFGSRSSLILLNSSSILSSLDMLHSQS